MRGAVVGSDDSAALSGLAVIAHELKNPISLMRQLSLILSIEGLSENDKRNYQKQLLVTADRALSLTTDLTKSFNLQPSLFPLEPVNPFSVCQVVANETFIMTKIYGRNISWPKARRNTLMIANAKLLERVLANFINNAIRYTEPDVPIVVGVKQMTDSVRLSVRDFGPQLKKEEYRRIVDDLESMKQIRTRPDSSGLGIYLAAKFAEAMKGKVGLVRHRDGVTFFVEVPKSMQMSWL